MTDQTPMHPIPTPVLEAVAFNVCSLHGFDPAWVAAQERFARAVVTEYLRASTPARAEAQDEGAAGVPVAWRKFSTPVAQAAYDVFRREGWMRGDIDRFYVQGFHNISKPERGEGSKRAAVWWAGRDRAVSGLPSGIPDDRGAAHPSPTPAPDADKVREALARIVKNHGAYIERLPGVTGLSDLAFARAALKSAAAKEGG